MANRSLAPSEKFHFGPAAPTRGRRRVFLNRGFFVRATDDSRFGATERGGLRDAFVVDLPDFVDVWLILCEVLRARDALFADADLMVVSNVGAH